MEQRSKGRKVLGWLSVAYIGLIVFIDRVIMLPVIWHEQPAIQDAIELKHERERIIRRFALYVICALTYSLYKLAVYLIF